ncbi:glutamate racemase [Bacteroidia bacterium]|nr:glutamate racemase [Bacteroidia bacterium]
MKENSTIGIFDSGYGGLTVLKEVVKALPQYDYIYLGDNARTPYGTRSFDVVYSYTKEAVGKLYEMGCRLIVLACNTASAKALRTIQQRDIPELDSSLRVLGVIRPSVEHLASLSKNRHVGILATNGTVRSNSYLLEVEKLYGVGAFQITQLACPMWVPLVENNELKGDGTSYFVKKYMDELFCIDPQIDTVLLACTHYPLLKEVIREHTPARVRLVEQGAIVAESLRQYLHRHPEIDDKLSRHGTIEYYTTEKAELFESMAEVFLGEKVSVSHTKLISN